MNLQTIKVAAEYSSLALYGLGLLGFFVFALTLLKTSFKHFVVTALLGLVWPIFIAVALFRQKKVSKAPQYIEIRR